MGSSLLSTLASEMVDLKDRSKQRVSNRIEYELQVQHPSDGRVDDVLSDRRTRGEGSSAGWVELSSGGPDPSSRPSPKTADATYDPASVERWTPLTSSVCE